MPLGFSKSTGNNRALAESGKRRRGGHTGEVLKCHIPGKGPVRRIGGGGGVAPDHRQAFAFADPTDVELSFVRRDDLEKHQLLEMENDLIAAHIVEVGEVPAAQFLG